MENVNDKKYEYVISVGPYFRKSMSNSNSLFNSIFYSNKAIDNLIKKHFNGLCRDVYDGLFPLDQNEKYILDEYIFTVYAELDELFEANLFPIWVLKDAYKDDTELSKLIKIKSNPYTDNKLNIFDISRENGNICTLIYYCVLISNSKSLSVFDKYLKYKNRVYLYNILVYIRNTYKLEKNKAKEIAFLISSIIENPLDRRKDGNDEPTIVANALYSVLEKYNSKAETTFTSNNDDASNNSSLPVVLPSKEEIKNIYEKENEKGEEEMEKIIDTIETVGKDGKILYTADINDKEEEVKDIADYILNQDASHIYSRDTNTGKKGINFFDYSELKEFYISTVKNKSAYKYKIVSDALLNMIKSDAVKVLVLDYEKNPFFHVSLKRIKDLDEGIIWIYTTSKDCLIKAIYDSRTKNYSYKLFVGLTLSEKDEL